MVSSPITSGKIEWEKLETVTDFIFLGSKITANSDCSHEIKRCLLPGRRPMISVFKTRDIILWTKTHIAKPIVFLVVMYGCGVGP